MHCGHIRLAQLQATPGNSRPLDQLPHLSNRIMEPPPAVPCPYRLMRTLPPPPRKGEVGGAPAPGLDIPAGWAECSKVAALSLHIYTHLHTSTHICASARLAGSQTGTCKPPQLLGVYIYIYIYCLTYTYIRLINSCFQALTYSDLYTPACLPTPANTRTRV